MKCPYCELTFDVTEEDLGQKERFKCPHCRKFNEGSDSADENGVLIGTPIHKTRSEELADDDFDELKQSGDLAKFIRQVSANISWLGRRSANPRLIYTERLIMRFKGNNGSGAKCLDCLLRFKCYTERKEI